MIGIAFIDVIVDVWSSDMGREREKGKGRQREKEKERERERERERGTKTMISSFPCTHCTLCTCRGSYGIQMHISMEKDLHCTHTMPISCMIKVSQLHCYIFKPTFISLSSRMIKP